MPALKSPVSLRAASAAPAASSRGCCCLPLPRVSARIAPVWAPPRQLQLQLEESSPSTHPNPPLLALGWSFDSANQQHPYRNRVAAAEIAEIPSWRAHTSAQLVSMIPSTALCWTLPPLPRPAITDAFRQPCASRRLPTRSIARTAPSASILSYVPPSLSRPL